MTPFIEQISYEGGYISSQSPLVNGTKNFLNYGSENLVVTGEGVFESFKGFYNESLSGGGLMWDTYGANHLYIDGAAPASCTGNLWMGTGKSIWGIGTNTAKYYDAAVPTTHTLGNLTTSGGALQVWTLAAGTYTRYSAGLSVASSGSLLAINPSGAFTGKLLGTVSAKFTKYRTITGAESQPSNPTAVVQFEKQYARITFPAAAALTDGSDRYRLYLSFMGLGTSGDWFFMGEYKMQSGWVSSDPFSSVVTLSGGSYYIDIEWYDSNLLEDTPPFDAFPPPVGTHGFQMGNVNCVVGTYGGLGLSSSIPNHWEMFPPSSTSFLSEQPIGVIGKPADGFVYILCKNSVWAAVWTGAPDGAAVIPRAVWNEVGVQNQSGACVVKGNLYAFTGRRGICRTSGSNVPETSFAHRVAKDIKDWDATKVVVSYSPSDDAVTFAHDREILMYHIDRDLWSTPIKLNGFLTAVSGNVASTFTRNGFLHVSLYDGSVYSLYLYNYWVTAGAGNPTGSNWKARSSWRDAGAGLYQKTITRIINSADTQASAMTTKVGKNLSMAVAAYTKAITPSAAGDQHEPWQRTNIRNAKTYAVELSGSGLNHTVYGSEVHGAVCRIRV